MSEKKQKRQRRDDVDSNHSGGNGNNEEVNNGNEEEDMRTSFENHHLYENPEYLSYVMNQTLHNRDEKRIKKIQQRFALNLLQNAQENSWEDHELARLFLLISNTINFSNKKRLKFLKKTQLYSTEFLACLGDEGIHLSTQDIISILQSNARNVNELIKILDQNLEHGVIDISNKEFLDFIHDLVLQQDYNPKQIIQLIRTLCTHCNSLTTCGQILNKFYHDHDVTIACKQMSDILNHPYIFELEGTITDFLSQFQEINSQMEEMLSSLFQIDDFGKIIPFQESDEDENGNLRGFIEDDDDENIDDDYHVAHSDSLSSSTESDDGNSVSSESQESQEAIADEDASASEDNLLPQRHHESYQISQPSKSHEKKKLKQKKNGIFHEKKVKIQSTREEEEIEEEEEAAMILESIETDTPAHISISGRVTIVESSDEEFTQKRSKNHQNGGKAKMEKKKKPKAGKRVIIEDSSEDEF